MLWRSDKGKDKLDKEKLLEENHEAKRMYDEIRALRESLDALKQNTPSQPNMDSQETPQSAFRETEEMRLAREAVIQQAQRDAAEKARKEHEARLKEIETKKKEQEIHEAERRALAVQQEAEKKRREARIAESFARDVSIKQMVNGRGFQQPEGKDQEEDKLKSEREAFFTEETSEYKRVEEKKIRRNLDEARTELLAYQKEQKRADKLEEAHRKRENKIRKTLEREKARKARREAAIDAKERLEKERIRAAEQGAGIVNVNGVKVRTELNDRPSFSWKDFFGIKGKEERKVAKEADDAKQRALEKEIEARKEEARLIAEFLSKERQEKYMKSAFGKIMNRFKGYCEKHKTVLLSVFAIVLLAVVGTAGIFNYCTAYEYSYNGKALGYVKEKDDVLRITDLVQGALTEDKKMNVVIDAKDDIEFNRVSAMGDVEIDSSDDVLKRLSYMGDVNVKAIGIYINGKKVGAVDNKETAAKVIKNIEKKYSCNEKGAKVEEAVFIEDVEVKQSNTALEDISTKKEMIDILCTSGEKETVHKVVVGETLADIAKLYSLTEDDIMKDNKDIDPKKLDVGTSLVIKQNAPLLTVKITYVITHDKVIEHKVEKKDAPDIYEGYDKTSQAGKDGLNTVKERITTVNGESIEAKALATTVKEEPVTEIILVGTKERPPTVGSGKYIWPISSGYTVTSRFGVRWGRMHEGIDLGIGTGATVMAADGGTVVSAGYEGAYGYSIVIDHQNGMKTRYAHNSRLLVGTGEKVFQGQEIARSGNTGRSTGPHLHFEILVNGSPVNPMNYLP